MRVVGQVLRDFGVELSMEALSNLMEEVDEDNDGERTRTQQDTGNRPGGAAGAAGVGDKRKAAV